MLRFTVADCDGQVLSVTLVTGNEDHSCETNCITIVDWRWKPRRKGNLIKSHKLLRACLLVHYCIQPGEGYVF